MQIVFRTQIYMMIYDCPVSVCCLNFSLSLSLNDHRIYVKIRDVLNYTGRLRMVGVRVSL